MSHDYAGLYASLGPSGLMPFLTPVEGIPTFKLVLNTDHFDPYRGAGAGRAYPPGYSHIYTADRIDVCSGEALGSAPPPSKAMVEEYRVSGSFVDIDQIVVPGFQDAWRACSGERRHDFSQQFTHYLHQNGYFPSGAIGFTWTSVSGQALGIGGRCYATTVTGEPHVVFQSSSAYPKSA